MNNISNSTENKGGIFKGKSHAEGGIPFVVPETNQHIEVEGDEPLISAEALNDPNIYEYYGDNFEILNTINKSVGAKGLTEKATQVRAGDVIICKKTLWDKTKKRLKGTNRQVISAINTEAGCAVIEEGATITDENGNTTQFKDGGETTKRYVAEADFYVHANSDIEAEKEAKEIAHELDKKYQNNAMVNHLTETPFGLGNSRVVFEGGGELEQGIKVEKEHMDLYGELEKRLKAKNIPMVISKHDFF